MLEEHFNILAIKYLLFPILLNIKRGIFNLGYIVVTAFIIAWEIF